MAQSTARRAVISPVNAALSMPSATNSRALDEDGGRRRRTAPAPVPPPRPARASRAFAPAAAEHADHRRLAGLRVLAGRFADQRRIAFEIEQIVGDLEGLADRRSIARRALCAARRRRSRACRRPGRRSATARRSSSPAASAPRSRQAAAGRRRQSGPRRRDRASGRRPCRRAPDARASAPTSSMRTAGSGWVSRPRQDVEGEGQQPVAGEDGGRLVEFLVRGRLAAPQRVVVHGRQIVVHQRVAMHAFERGAGHQRLLPRDVEQARAFDHQKRPEPLAAAEARIAHGLDQPRRAGSIRPSTGRRGKKPVEQRLDIRGHRVEARRERVLGFLPFIVSLPSASGVPVGCYLRSYIYGITGEPPAAWATARQAVTAVQCSRQGTICGQRPRSVNGAGDLALSPGRRAGDSGCAAERDDGGPPAARPARLAGRRGGHPGARRGGMRRRDRRFAAAAGLSRRLRVSSWSTTRAATPPRRSRATPRPRSATPTASPCCRDGRCRRAGPASCGRSSKASTSSMSWRAPPAYLLFTDADIVYAPDALLAACGARASGRCSCSPR